MNSHDAPTPRMLVRSYSGEVEQRLRPTSDARILGQVLSSQMPSVKEQRNPWRRFFDPQSKLNVAKNPITSVIATESALLCDKWRKFQETCAKDDQLDLQQYEPSIESMVELVTSMQRVWQAKRDSGRRGAAVRGFHRFCGGVEAHSNLLKLLPEGNEYVSIFSGTITTIIKQASVNHERIAEAFSQSLIRISEHILECKSELELYDTELMQELTAKFYANIFGYLSSVMDWLTKTRLRRMLDSFKEDFKEHFEAEVACIERIAKQVRDLASFSGRAELRSLRTGYEADVENIGAVLNSIEQNTRIGLEGQERQNAELQYYAESIRRVLLAEHHERRRVEVRTEHLFLSIKSMLEDRARASSPMPATVTAALQCLDHEPREAAPVSFTRTLGAQTYMKDDIALWSSHLEDYFHRDHIRLESLYQPHSADDTEVALPTPLHHVMSSQMVVERLAEWTRPATSPSSATASRLLWLSGPADSAEDIDNPLTTLSYNVLALASRAGVPLLSYFCELRRDEQLRSDMTSMEVQGLISLIYCLIRQQVEQLLQRFDSTIALTPTRFQQLDGSEASLPVAMALFAELLPLMPNPVFCVIDGLHWLDDRTTDAPLEALVKTFGEHENVRVLFTTTGRSGCLMDGIRPEDMMEVSGREGDWGMRIEG